MDVKVYNVKIETFSGGYGYRKEHLAKYTKAALIVSLLGLNIELIDPNTVPLKLNDKGEETYDSYIIAETGAADNFVVTEKQLVLLAVNNIDFKVINETAIEVDDIVKTTGKIITTTNIQTISTIYSGRLEEIFVKEGSYVNEGDTLLKISTEDVKSDYEKKQLEKLSTLAKIVRVNAEANMQNLVPDEYILEKNRELMNNYLKVT